MRRSVAVESVSPPVSSVMTGTFQELPITDIHESALLTNPRATFDQDALDELAASIRLRGVLQPILVRPRSHDSGYELIAGARRLRASRLAQIATIPAHVVTFDDQAAREAAIIENLQRQDVHPLEEAEAYERLMAADTLVTADTIAAKVGKSATYVYARLTLLRLQPDIRDAFRRDIITAAHAQRLATVPADRQAEAFARCFFNLLQTGTDAVDRNNLAPMKQLDEWLQKRVALNVHHEDTTRFLPALVEAVSEHEQGGAEILALSTLTFHTDLREPKPILARSWVLAEGKKHTCPHARPGVIVLGDDRGRLLQVCIAKRQCAKHWGKRSERTAERTADAASRQAASERAARDQARRERERMFWEQQLRPALLSAIAEKAKQQKTITRPLITAVLETLTMRDDDLTTWCGPTAKLPADRFAAALLMALALREQFSQDRLSSFAKGLRVNVPALCKRLKADKPDEPTS
jgi:ParB/RepB/Spo0J family partition protein